MNARLLMRGAPKARALTRALAILFLLAAAPACDRVDAEPARPTAPEPVRLESVEIERVSVSIPVVGTGSIAALKTTNIGARVGGILDKVFVAVGDRVKTGDPLLRIRQVDYRIRVRQAEQALRLAKAEREKARRDVQRIQPLHDQGAASDRRLDEVKTALEITDARVGEADAQLERARQDLSDTIVTAPYRGVITAKHYDEGAMLSTRGAAAAVVQLMKTDVVVAIVQIPGVHLPRVHVGTRGVLRIDGVEGRYPSVVAVLNDSVDPQSRAFEIRLPVANADLAIKPGLFVRAELTPDPRVSVVAPRSAVLGGGDARYVLIAEAGMAVRRDVTVRELDATRVEIVDGLNPGEHILSGPRLAFVRPGERVRVRSQQRVRVRSGDERVPVRPGDGRARKRSTDPPARLEP